MAIQITLNSNIDFEATYRAVKKCEYADEVTEIEKGTFSFGLRTKDGKCEGIRIQVAHTGSINIWTDNDADKGHLINIVWLLCELQGDGDPHLHIKNIQLLPNAAKAIAAAALLKELGVNSCNPYLDLNELTRREIEGIRSVFWEVERLQGLRNTVYSDVVKAGEVWSQGKG